MVLIMEIYKKIINEGGLQKKHWKGKINKGEFIFLWSLEKKKIDNNLSLV